MKIAIQFHLIQFLVKATHFSNIIVISHTKHTLSVYYKQGDQAYRMAQSFNMKQNFPSSIYILISTYPYPLNYIPAS